MSKYALPCIKCNKPLVNVDADTGENQPRAGTEFVAVGHYGSTIHGPIGDEEPLVLIVNICDTCILRAIEKDVLQSRGREGAPRLAHHHVDAAGRAWVLAQNEKQYGCAWGDDYPVDYREEMLKAGWPEDLLDKELS